MEKDKAVLVRGFTQRERDQLDEWIAHNYGMKREKFLRKLIKQLVTGENDQIERKSEHERDRKNDRDIGEKGDRRIEISRE